MNMAILTKECILLGLSYSFRGLVCYQQHGGSAAGMVLEKYFGVLHPESYILIHRQREKETGPDVGF